MSEYVGTPVQILFLFDHIPFLKCERQESPKLFMISASTSVFNIINPHNLTLAQVG